METSNFMLTVSQCYCMWSSNWEKRIQSKDAKMCRMFDSEIDRRIPHLTSSLNWIKLEETSKLLIENIVMCYCMI